MKRRALMIGAGGVAALGGAGLALWTHGPSSGQGLPPDFWTRRFDRPEGGELALAELRGKPLLINFWATWCVPCVREMPMLDRFHRGHQASGWQLIGLAVDSPTPVRDFLKRTPIGFPIGLAGLGGVDLVKSLGNSDGGLPFSLMLDRHGAIHARRLGALDDPALLAWFDQTR